MSKNPNWLYEELILALELYFRISDVGFDKGNQEIIELSNILRSLQLHDNRLKQESFRNPAGVAMKLSNFRRFDPKYQGKGLTRGAKLEEKVWEEFATNRESLKANSFTLRSLSKTKNEAFDFQSVVSVYEGNIYYKLHKFRERKRSIVNKKKRAVMKDKGRLQCEVCEFDFHESYGPTGAGYIECHHIEPLGENNEITETRLEDLAIVCSNCHRMLHSKTPALSIEELKKAMRL